MFHRTHHSLTYSAKTLLHKLSRVGRRRWLRFTKFLPPLCTTLDTSRTRDYLFINKIIAPITHTSEEIIAKPQTERDPSHQKDESSPDQVTDGSDPGVEIEVREVGGRVFRERHLLVVVDHPLTVRLEYVSHVVTGLSRRPHVTDEGNQSVFW